MSTTRPRAFLAVTYEAAAQDYLRSLPPEHFMEAAAQGKQREITLESFAVVHAKRPDIQLFNELLTQFKRRRQRRPGQVVPDNMVVVWHEPIQVEGHFDVPLQPAKPFWMLEYVSKYNKRKDYNENFDIYEQELKVPYFLLFYPDSQELTLYRHDGTKYNAVRPNKHGRLAVPELEMEVALLDGWVRFWFRGELLPLPGDLLRELTEAKARLDDERRQLIQERQRTQDLEGLLARERQTREALESELERLRTQQRK